LAFYFLLLCRLLNFAISNAIGYAKFYSRSHQAVIRVLDEAGNVIETHEYIGDFKEWEVFTRIRWTFPLKPISMTPVSSCDRELYERDQRE